MRFEDMLKALAYLIEKLESLGRFITICKLLTIKVPKLTEYIKENFVLMCWLLEIKHSLRNNRMAKETILIQTKKSVTNKLRSFLSIYNIG